MKSAVKHCSLIYLILKIKYIKQLYINMQTKISMLLINVVFVLFIFTILNKTFKYFVDYVLKRLSIVEMI